VGQIGRGWGRPKKAGDNPMHRLPDWLCLAAE
jgi:hypothetical protein